MKPHLRIFLTCALLALGTGHTHADGEAPKLRKAIDKLQEAKKADNPLPLLENAKTSEIPADIRGRAGGQVARLEETGALLRQ